MGCIFAGVILPHVKILEGHVSYEDWPSNNGILPVGGCGSLAKETMRGRHVLGGIFWTVLKKWKRVEAVMEQSVFLVA